MSGPRDLEDLEEEGRALVERLGGRWSPQGGLCRCPAHDDRTPSLSVRAGRTSLLFHCFAGCAAADILRALRTAGGLRSHKSPGTAAPRLTGERSGASSHGAALRVWGGARPIEGTPAEHYLESRGLCTDSTQLRYHPGTPHGPRPVTTFRPAMIAAVRDKSGLVAVHRTFLDPQHTGLAPIEQPRCGLGRFGSGAVRLGGTAAKLGLAEGIETALSASILFGLPCWATLGAERFGSVDLPGEVKALVLFLDNDLGGSRAAALAHKAFAHLPIEIRRPRRPGTDWNDVLRAQ